jgi:hypothetical protein
MKIKITESQLKRLIKKKTIEEAWYNDIIDMIKNSAPVQKVKDLIDKFIGDDPDSVEIEEPKKSEIEKIKKDVEKELEKEPKKEKTEKSKNDKEDSDFPKHIIIGDSLCTFIDNASSKAKRISTKNTFGNPNEKKYLWQGGTNLSWLKDAVETFPEKKSVETVVISTGTNSSYSQRDNISGLISSIKDKFPNAKIIVVPGGWNVGSGSKKLIDVSKDTVNNYYKRFKELGVSVTTPVGDAQKCCNGDLHGNYPIYNKIGQEIDGMID